MAWRQQGSTGSNNIPLGTRRRFGGDNSQDNLDSGYGSSRPDNGDGAYKRGRSPVKGEHPESPLAHKHTNRAIQMKLALMDRDVARREIAGAMPRRTKQLASWAFQLPSWPI
jgi:hypothetical protein